MDLQAVILFGILLISLADAFTFILLSRRVARLEEQMKTPKTQV